MNPEQSSISIINKNNGQLTGESSNALPIKLVTNNLAIKFFSFGFLTAMVVLLFMVFTIKRQVVAVDATGVAPQFQEYKLSE